MLAGYGRVTTGVAVVSAIAPTILVTFSVIWEVEAGRCVSIY
jgi:hypothetical protein